ncbi:DUF1656 domain-containing protein [Alsobacter sp. KACC 23698]|uniref:DUF1656 domain-containing protein n=1 Tax=Alsobacter sp. KACC 23698 TaxID=3149229 RepID=A0AAU7JE21_9HYPH
MIRELDVFGVFLSPLAALLVIAAVVWLVLRRGLALAGVERRVWHPALFNLSAFVLILSALVLIVFGRF